MLGKSFLLIAEFTVVRRSTISIFIVERDTISFSQYLVYFLLLIFIVVVITVLIAPLFIHIVISIYKIGLKVDAILGHSSDGLLVMQRAQLLNYLPGVILFGDRVHWLLFIVLFSIQKHLCKLFFSTASRYLIGDA